MDGSLVISIIVIASFIYYWYFSRPKYPPGPYPLPFIGNIPILKHLSRKHNGYHNAITKLCEAYNTDILALKLGKDYTVVVQSEDLLNQVLSQDEFQARPDNFFLRLRSMGKRAGITMTDGPLWSEQRAFVFKHLHELGLGRRKMDELIQKELLDFLSTMEVFDIKSTSLRKMLSKCVLNVLWVILTGETFKNNKQRLNDLISFMELRAKAFDQTGGLLGLLPFLRFICPDYCGFNLIQKLNIKFKAMMMEIIENHKNTYNPAMTRDFIDAFLHEMNRNKSASFNEDQLIQVCLDIFIAGSQTTSSTLDFLLLHIIQNPDVQEKIQHELDSVLKCGDIPSAQDRILFPYIEAAILESQRMSSVAPIIGPRRALCNTTLGGYFIPKGTTILLNLVPYNNDSKKWETPEVMKPERFLDGNGKLLSGDRLYSFGKGKRRCPGEALAKNFLFVFLSGFLFNYKLQLQDLNSPPSIGVVPGITLTPAEYGIKMIKRFS